MWRVYNQRPKSPGLLELLLAPHWPTQAGLVATFWIVLLPLLALVAVAMLIGVFVFAVLLIAARLIALPVRLMQWTTALIPDDEGRRNVRVIHRD